MRWRFWLSESRVSESLTLEEYNADALYINSYMASRLQRLNKRNKLAVSGPSLQTQDQAKKCHTFLSREYKSCPIKIYKHITFIVSYFCKKNSLSNNFIYTLSHQNKATGAVTVHLKPLKVLFEKLHVWLITPKFFWFVDTWRKEIHSVK